MLVPLYNKEGKQEKKIELDAEVFDGEINREVLYQAILMYRANSRKGLASTKTRGEVSGGGKKPWRQKGTGRARVGSSRNPLWRKGGVAFGPHPRDFGYKLPKKIKLAALKSSLNAKLNDGNMYILNGVESNKPPKTKEAAKLLRKLKIKTNNTLLLLKEINENLKLSFRNIKFLNLTMASEATAYDILTANKLVISQDGLKILLNRIKKEGVEK